MKEFSLWDEIWKNIPTLNYIFVEDSLTTLVQGIDELS